MYVAPEYVSSTIARFEEEQLLRELERRRLHGEIIEERRAARRAAGLPEPAGAARRLLTAITRRLRPGASAPKRHEVTP